MALAIPNTFVAETTALSAEVNENFTYLADNCVDKSGDTLTGTITTQALVPDVNNSRDLGSGTYKYKDLYLAGLLTGVTATFSGSVTLGGGASGLDSVLSRVELKDVSETSTAPAIAAGALTLDFENGAVFRVALNADVTITLSNPPATGKAGQIFIIFTADGTLRTITWPGSVVWPGGATAPTMTSTNNKRDLIALTTVDAGTTWFGTVIGQNY